MADKKKTIFSQFKGGLIAAFIIIGAIYAVVFFSFYDIYIFSRVHISEAKIWARQIREDADLKARALYFDNQMRANEKLLDAQNKAASLVTQARGNGVKEYYAAILQSRRDEAKAKEEYRDYMRLSRLEADFVRGQAKIKAENILKSAREEYSVLNLFLACRNNRKISGYYYDPSVGKLVPKLENEMTGEGNAKK